jgi:protein-tyrosine-phosphatase
MLAQHSLYTKALAHTWRASYNHTTYLASLNCLSHVIKYCETFTQTSFDLVISLSPEAHHRALELTRTNAIEAVYWPTMDPSVAAGSREQILEAYREVRDGLYSRIRARFGTMGAGGV